jgi:hypothetical protein
VLQSYLCAAGAAMFVWQRECHFRAEGLQLGFVCFFGGGGVQQSQQATI